MQTKQRYIILKELGSGGFSSVFLVNDIKLQKNWAMKRINKEPTSISWQCFQNEIQMLTVIDHPAIPRITDQFEDDQYYYVIMDFIVGIPLSQYDTPITEALLKDWMMQVCTILLYLHSLKLPILYLDLKPQNLLVNEHNRICLIDFGNSCFFSYKQHVVCGTPGFSAPEVIKGERLGKYSDVYSFGKTFLYVLHQSTLRTTCFHTLLHRCSAEDAASRYQNFKDIQKALTRSKLRSYKKIHCYLSILLAIIFFSIGSFLHFKIEELQQHAYYEAMKDKNYEQAISIYPHRLDAYKEAYHLVVEKEKQRIGKQEAQEHAILYLEKMILKNKGYQNQEIALYIALECMKPDDYLFYQKANTYFSYITDWQVVNPMYKRYYQISKLLGKNEELKESELTHIKELLLKQREDIEKIADVNVRYSQLYTLYHIYLMRRSQFREDAYRHELSILNTMKKLEKQYKGFIHSKIDVNACLEEAYYERGLWFYMQENYNAMNKDFKQAEYIRKQNKQVTDKDYRHTAISFYYQYKYGMQTAKKEERLRVLKEAYENLKKIKKANELDHDILKKVNTDLLFWR